ncbi:MAG: hypothetical protein M1834_000453 [Cirrosporium novae-zelandiae]|nr:MAG: hypothetical protein M1834_000453 [Cirrosporium novae-zelandiae]
MPEQGDRGQEEAGGGSGLMRQLVQGIGIFILMQFAMNTFFGSKQKDANGSPSAANVPSFDDRPDIAGLEHYHYEPFPITVAPMWPPNSTLDIAMYISPSVVVPALSAAPADSLVFDEKNFTMANWDDQREINTEIKVPAQAQQNGTIWAHYYVALTGYPLDPSDKNYDTAKAYHFFRPLNHYLPKKKTRKVRNLLHAANATEEEEEEPQSQGTIYGSYYHSNYTLSVIPDSGTQNYRQMHPAVRQHVTLEATGARDSSGQNAWYYPIIFHNTFWQLRDHMTELNSTVKTLPIHISLNNLNNWKFTLYASIDQGMKEAQRQAASGSGMSAGGDGSELEEVKRILLDTNIYLLSTTVIVSIFHMVFEMLAFKSDVSHWRNKKDNVGVSVRTILANVFMQAVIFLYLVDNNEGTSWMILFSQGMGVVLEAWKITKTVDVRVRPSPQGSWLPYAITFEDKHKLSDTEKKTQEYDQIAFKYLYIIAVPLLLAYAVYSVVYETHKSWYSFILTTLVGSVYAYGFLMMVPSLYINYRLKSVAHMPAKAMTYKFLNTFIDDLFAFTIKMPTLHRLATLRDDVIFFVYLYQCWKYRIDYSRVNEFGQGGNDKEEEKKKLEGLDSGNVPTAVAVEKASGREKKTVHKRK